MYLHVIYYGNGLKGAVCGAQLKLLACSQSGGRQQGDIWAQDEIVNPAVFRQQLSVVWQNDILLPTATVCTPHGNSTLPPQPCDSSLLV